jgi:hypothetical protein
VSHLRGATILRRRFCAARRDGAQAIMERAMYGERAMHGLVTDGAQLQRALGGLTDEQAPGRYRVEVGAMHAE